MLYLVALLVPPLAIALCHKWIQAGLSLVLTILLGAAIPFWFQTASRFSGDMAKENELPSGLRGLYTQYWIESSTAYMTVLIITVVLLVLAIGHALFVVHNHYADQRNDRLIEALHPSEPPIPQA